MLRDPDHFGASDAWLMFALWMWTAGHPVIAAFSGTVCLVICMLPYPKPADSAPGVALPLAPSDDSVIAWLLVLNGEAVDSTTERNEASTWRANGGDVRELVERTHGVGGTDGR